MDPNESSRVIKIGKWLKKELTQQLPEFLSLKQDVFAWTHTNMIGIHPGVKCHQMNIDPQVKLVRQKRRLLDANRYNAFLDEVDRLLKIGLIRESYYSDWLANPVLIIKTNGKWRTCIDFMNLNKVCRKYSFPLPLIDQLVDATVGYKLLSFMDVYSRYNQISMFELGDEHTSFNIDRGLYYYKAMPFGLKNAGATY